MLIANRVAEILDKTDVSQCNHVSGIKKPADIRTRARTDDVVRRTEWLTGPEWLKQPENDWQEQLTLRLASDEQNEQKAFVSTTEEKKPIVHLGTVKQFPPTRKCNSIFAASIEQNKSGNKSNWP